MFQVQLIDMLPLFASRRPRAKDAAACQSKVDRRSRWVKRFQEWWMNDVQLKVVDIARPHAEHNSTRPSMCLKLCHHRNSFIAQRCKPIVSIFSTSIRRYETQSGSTGVHEPFLSSSPRGPLLISSDGQLTDDEYSILT